MNISKQSEISVNMNSSVATIFGCLLILFTDAEASSASSAKKDPRRQKLPPPMDLKTFLDTVPNREWKQLYIIVNAPRFLTNYEIYISVNFSNDKFATVTSFDKARTLEGACSFTSNVQISIPQNTTPVKAEFISQYGSNVRYFSDNPQKYLFLFFCYVSRDDTSIDETHNICNGEWVVTLHSADRKPHQFPWGQVVEELERKTALNFKSEFSTWIPIDDCAKCPEEQTICNTEEVKISKNDDQLEQSSCKRKVIPVSSKNTKPAV